MLDNGTNAFVQAFNTQLAVDGQSQVIVACAVTQQVNDKQQLTPMVEAVKANLGEQPARVLADAGYWNEERIAEQIAKGIEVLTPPDAERRKPGEPLHPNAPRGPLAMKMRARLEEEEERKKYRKRAGIVEPVFGFIKEQRGFRRFLLRGITKVRAEWSLTCAAVNLWRLFRHGYKPLPI